MHTIAFPSGLAAQRGWISKFKHLAGVSVSSNSIEVQKTSDVQLLFLAEVIMDRNTQVGPALQDLFVSRMNGLAEGYLRNTSAEVGSLTSISGVGEGITVKPHQLAGIESILRIRKGWLGDDLGAGKTLMSLAAATEGKQLPCLAVVKPTTVGTWKKEQEKFLPGFTSVILQGETPYDLPPADFYMIGYSVLQHWEEALQAVGLKAFIFDEAHKLCTAGSNQSKAARRLTKGLDDENIVMLITTTPLKKGPYQMWNHIDTLGITNDFAGGWLNYGDLFCDRKKQYGRDDMTGTSNASHLHDLVLSEFMVRRLKHTYLPPEVAANCGVEQSDFNCQLTAAQWKKYMKLKSDSDEELLSVLAESMEIDASLVPEHERSKLVAKILSSKHRMLKIGRGEIVVKKKDENGNFVKPKPGEEDENHAKFTKTRTMGQYLNSIKLPHIVGWLEEFREEQPDEKIVVFARSRDMQRALSGRELDEREVREFAFTKKDLKKAKQVADSMGAETIFSVQDQGLDGISDAIERFQTDPTCRMIVVSMGNVESHTLTAAWYVMWADPAYSRSDEEQGEGRVAGRVNDPHGAFSFRTIMEGPDGEETVDHSALRNIRESGESSGAILNGKKFNKNV